MNIDMPKINTERVLRKNMKVNAEFACSYNDFILDMIDWDLITFARIT